MSESCTHCGRAHPDGPRCPITGALIGRPGPCGSVIDRYRIDHWLGGGGFASVYEATQLVTDRPVAIKLLHHERLSDPSHVERLLRESRAGAAIRHPRVIDVYDAGLSGEGQPFVVMKLIRGIDLGTLLKRERALPPARAVKIALQILEAVAAAHAAGVLHRDIKPANVMLGPGAEAGVDDVTLLDFGIASLRMTTGLGRLTESGATLGTPGYMAPEQLLSSRGVDERVDVYAVAVILFRMLTGDLPFAGETYAQLVLQVCTRRAPPIASFVAGLPDWLCNTIDRGLATDRDARWASAESFATALNTASVDSVDTTKILALPGTAAADGDTIVEPFQRSATRGAFVGRKTQLAVLGERFARGARLVTILGAGGMGKTRLAQQFMSDRPDAVFVDLSECESLVDVCGVIASALRVTPGSDPVTTVPEVLQHRRNTLLVLDNFERVVEVARETLGGWLDACPGARFLVTSRQRLSLPHEVLLELAPLGLPDSTQDPLTSDAVRMLLDRVRSLGGADPDPRALAEVARALDGIPLALELAAPRLVAVGPTELLARLRERLDLSSDEPRTGRHRTLEAAIAWSWELLDPGERLALARCSVFRGGFTLASAERVLGTTSEARGVRETLGRLRDKSMIYQWPSDPLRPVARLGLYQSIRDFAAARLDEADELDATRRRHAEATIVACHRLAEVDDPAMPETARFRELALEMDNLIAAIETVGSLDPLEGDDAIIGAIGLMTLAAARKQARDTHRLLHVFEQARSRIEPAAPRHLRPRITRARALLAIERGDFAVAARLSEQAYEGAMALGDSELAALTLLEGGLAISQIGRTDEGIERFARSLELIQSREDLVGIEAFALARLGIVHFVRGDLSLARALFEECIPMLQSAGKTELSGMATVNLGVVLQAQGELSAAEEPYRRAIEIAREMSNPVMGAFAMGSLGSLLHAMGRLDEAEAWFRDGAALAEPHPTYHRRVVAGYHALLAIERGDVALARAELDVARPKVEAEGDRDRWTYRSFRAVLLAMEGNPAGADAELTRLLAAIDPADLVDRRVVEAQRAHVLIAEAKLRPADASALLARAEELVAPLRAPGPSGEPAPIESYMEARLTDRIARRAIAKARGA